MESVSTPTASRHWRTVLAEQGRVDRNKTIAWLAQQTGLRPRTVYGYSNGSRDPSAAWIAAASLVLGEEVTA